MECVLCETVRCFVLLIDYYQFQSMSQEIVFRESSAVKFLVALRVMVY